MAVREVYLNLLRPYLIGDDPGADGEWAMFCPLHEDTKRSASLNVNSSEWYCQAGCGGGSVVELCSKADEWVPPPSDRVRRRAARTGSNGTGVAAPLPSEEAIQGLHSALQTNHDRMDWLQDVRLLTQDVIARYQLGWSQDEMCYTIPIRDRDGTLLNLRKYDPNPKDVRRKIWGIYGHNQVVLYPIDMLEADELGIVEGEWDALALISRGVPAITRTGTCLYWNHGWSRQFRGKRTWVCQDCDVGGQRGALKIIRSVEQYTEVDNIVLPYPIEKRHGKDVTDYLDEFPTADPRRLIHREPPQLDPSQNGHGKMDHLQLVKVVDSLDATHVGEPVQVALSIVHKREPGYAIPKAVKLQCDKSAGQKCNHCPLFQTKDGADTIKISPHDAVLLNFIGTPEPVIQKKILEQYGVPQAKCHAVRIGVSELYSVESMTGRQSLDGVGGLEASDYETAHLYNIGTHNTSPNTTMLFTGALHPHPRTQENVLMTWESERQETIIDRFDITPETAEMMWLFRPRVGQRPLDKIMEIAQDLSEHVTIIYDRPEMHALMDLVWHSVISWNFNGRLVTKGWLEALIIGDTQQGKSEAARRLSRHYQAGEIVNCEAASFAGVVGGLQRLSGDWGLTWGVIPINSGRLVVMEEASGLTQEQISQMSEIRSSGVVRITKIVQQETVAKTRLLWLSNPRKKHMSDFTYGVQAIKQLIGNDEDIARFDLAMSVSSGDVTSQVMNDHRGSVRANYTSDACAALVRWAWTRRPEHVLWDEGAEQEVLRSAVAVSGQYISSPPLVQPSNVRFKIARLAVAIAARTFSSDETNEHLIVKREHVEDAVRFMHTLYGMKGFGYAEISASALRDNRIARENYDDIKRWLSSEGLVGLSEFMIDQPRFRRQDLEEVLDVERTFANQIISRLISTKMARKEGANVCVQPTLNAVLRELTRDHERNHQR